MDVRNHGGFDAIAPYRFIVDPVTGEIANVEANGGLAVNVQDQTSQIVGAPLLAASGAPKTLSGATVVGSYTIDLTSGHGFTGGESIFIAEGNREFFASVISVAVDTLTLDQPIDYAFSTSAGVLKVNCNMVVDGSTTAIGFVAGSASGSNTVSLDITGIRFIMTDNAEFDDSKFGGGSALTRGIVMRKLSAGVVTKTYWNAKTNGDLALAIDNKLYTDKAGGGNYSGEFTWAIRDTLGVTIRLDPGEQLQMLIQDDLTGLLSFKSWVYGHIVTD